MMLDRLGRMFVVALALPEYVRSKVTDLQVADQAAAGLGDLVKKANGERDEARHSVAVLRDEMRLVSAERDGYRADVDDVTKDRDAARAAEAAAHEQAKALAAEADRLRSVLAGALATISGVIAQRDAQGATQ